MGLKNNNKKTLNIMPFHYRKNTMKFWGEKMQCMFCTLNQDNNTVQPLDTSIISTTQAKWSLFLHHVKH